jgi:hypothetical protein
VVSASERHWNRRNGSPDYWNDVAQLGHVPDIDPTTVGGRMVLGDR